MRTLKKELLEQARQIKGEIEDIKEQIKRLEEQSAMTCDKVKGSMDAFPYIATTFNIRGIDINSNQIYKKESSIKRYIILLKEKELDLQETQIEIEEFLSTIPDAYMRRIIRLRCISGMQWVQVANKVGGNIDSVRMAYKRYVNKNCSESSV